MKDAFELSFGYDCNWEVWRKLGFFPFTRKCLQDSKVKHEVVVLDDGTIDIDADPTTVVLMEFEKENKQAVCVLNNNGFDGSQLAICPPKISAEKKIAVTVPGSIERQELLLKANTAGK